MPASRVRATRGIEFLIGRSVHTVTEARHAEEDGGADYLIFGTVFPSAGKPEGHPIAGVEGLAAVCASVRLPVLAIGGVTVARVADVAAAGAAGIAGIGVFAGAGQRGGLDCLNSFAACGRRLTLADPLSKVAPPHPLVAERSFMTDFGGKLRQARERRGVSLRQIAATTKISVASLEALERNDLSRLPGGIFSRAFVRSYAQEVGLDPDETVREFIDRFQQETG